MSKSQYGIWKWIFAMNALRTCTANAKWMGRIRYDEDVSHSAGQFRYYTVIQPRDVISITRSLIRTCLVACCENFRWSTTWNFGLDTSKSYFMWIHLNIELILYNVSSFFFLQKWKTIIKIRWLNTPVSDFSSCEVILRFDCVIHLKIVVYLIYMTVSDYIYIF